MAEQKQGDKPESTYSYSVRTECTPGDLPEAMNDKGGDEGGAGISILAARQDDDDESPDEDLLKL